MFCSNCGKTLKPDAVSCPHCGAVIGESRFDGHPYTGAQIRTKPGEAIRLPGNHTKTTFMGSEPSMDGDVDSRTTYRATRGGDVPKYVQEEETGDFYDEYAPDAATEPDFAQTPQPTFEKDARPEKAPETDELDAFDDEDDEDDDLLPRKVRKAKKKRMEEKKRAQKSEEEEDAEALAELRARDITLERRAGISADVQKFIGELHEEDVPAAKKKKPVFGRKKREEFDLNEDLPPAYAASLEDSASTDAEELPPEDADFDLDAEDVNFDDVLPAKRQWGGIIKYAVAAAVVLAVLVGVIVGLSYITNKTKKAPIDNVTLSLYNQGIELMNTRVGKAYQTKMMGYYDGSANSLIVFSDAMSEDLDSLATLMPETPGTNDQVFIAALSAIQENINNCLTNDVLALSDNTKTTEVKEAESNERWATVRATVTALGSATSGAQLEGIIKGERIEVIEQTTPTPVPTQTPAPYTTLSKGSQGASVTELQTRLTELGYLNSEIDGSFGNKTKTAVQLFQQTAGIEATGIADLDTQIALYADTAPKYTAGN